MIAEYVSEKLRLRYRALEPFDPGEQERRAVNQLRPRTGQVDASPNRPRAVLAAEGTTEAD
ncbi:MAG: hypothetical protein JWN10_927 [Solirubrobacterales bacterium]|nr:hypothetical protein [Solirubrobacterales bacterium]